MEKDLTSFSGSVASCCVSLVVHNGEFGLTSWPKVVAGKEAHWVFTGIGSPSNVSACVGGGAIFL